MRIIEELLGKLYNSVDSLHDRTSGLGNLVKLEDRAGESTQALQKAICILDATLQRVIRFEKRFKKSLEKGLKTSNYQCLGIVHNHGDDTDDEYETNAPESLPSSFTTICISDGLRARKVLESIYESSSTAEAHAEEIIEASKLFPWLPVRVECYDSFMTGNTTSHAQRLYIYAGDPNLILKNWLKTQVTPEWKKVKDYDELSYVIPQFGRTTWSNFFSARDLFDQVYLLDGIVDILPPDIIGKKYEFKV